MSLTDLDPTGTAESLGSKASGSNLNPLNIIASGRGYLDTLTNKYILKPANAKGLAGFIFDYEGDTQVVVQSEITDHYSEQNTFVNDQAAQKPQKITLRGFVGELMANPTLGVLGAIATLQGKLSTLPVLLGKYTPGAIATIAKAATQATEVVNKIDTTISRAQNIVGLFIGSAPALTKQQLAYQQLYALWSNNTVFTLDTPFNYFRSVMIEQMVFVQDETTKEWSEISVTVKEMRFSGVVEAGPGMSAQLAAATQMGRSAQQAQSTTNKGKTGGLFSSFGNVKGGF